MEEVKIDKELQKLIPPLTIEEHDLLEQSLKTEGCRDALVLWNGTIVDGHNRYALCTKHNIPFKTTNKDFTNKTDAKLWIISNQKARRNLTDGWKYKLALTERALLAEKGRLKQAHGLTAPGKTLLPTIGKSDAHNTQKELAKSLGWSTGKVAMADKVWKKANEQEKDLIKKGEKSFNEAYKAIKEREREETKAKQKQEIHEKALTSPKQENVIQGDCLIELDKIPNKTVDLVYVDPPYNIKPGLEWDNKTETEYWQFTQVWLNKLLPKLKDTGRLFISFSQERMWKLHDLMQKTAPEHNLMFSNLIVWNYRNNVKPHNQKQFKYTWEPVFYYRKQGAGKLNKALGEWTEDDADVDVWTITMPQPQYNTDKKIHPTQKPIALLEKIIKFTTNEGDLVLDCFAGSGTTAIAARKLKRNWLLIEKEPEYVELITARLKEGVE
jgi:DNA modification methylase